MAAVRFSTLLGAIKYRIDLQDLPLLLLPLLLLLLTFLTILTCLTLLTSYTFSYLSSLHHFLRTPTTHHPHSVNNTLPILIVLSSFYSIPPSSRSLNSTINHHSLSLKYSLFIFMPSLPPLFLPFSSFTRSQYATGLAYIHNKQAISLLDHRRTLPSRPPYFFCSCPQGPQQALCSPTKETSITPLVLRRAME